MLGIIVTATSIALILNLILKKVHLPTIIGYILTGTIIAYTFNLHEAVNNHDLREIAEFGVVFLMFTIGLEFSLSHLKKMKREVFFTGSLQIIITAFFVFLIAKYILGFETQTSLIIGTALSLSSTAIVLKTFNETKEITKPYGRRVLGILIMQDIAVIPILLMISFFSMTDEGSLVFAISKTVIAAAVLLALLYFSGKYLLEPFLRYVSATRSDELFVASVLLLAVGSAYLAYYFGFSYSLGAFIAGMMIAETKFKHQVEADLIPFRNILLGVFFITVGMQINFKIISDYILIILVLLPLVMALKFAVIYVLVRYEDNKRVAFKTALSLIQIGEFSLAILELARSQSLIDPTYSQILIVTIVISMILTPIILKNLSKAAAKLIPEDVMMITNTYNVSEDTENHVIVLGYGRFGQAIVDELKAFGQKYVILEHNVKFYQVGKDKGEPIVFGNAAQKHILNSLNITKASAVIVAVNNPEILHLICEAVGELTHNSKTIVNVTTQDEKESLENLNLEHIIVATNQIAKAVVDEVMYCRLDNSKDYY
ncbi:MAG: cation:proton antiporter [Arcobacter sp.]|jgi:CPA2 family monovalent cation:H+ antiporter-2|uniref:Glutathione-regulated potassium-efflux system protein, KefB/KefC family n=1 Tax=Arcobacter defluvii TaxID=873191 RepID=A0AAE7BEJ6_9BACT|nr:MULTISPECIES: cation:proton antiporter [Arcobacter]MDY3199790.1 cation:proton antiporter [Arcobacter sp.]QKF76602.1 glutathione-regulated potassium-efflux system protein, KefB/KefC family [Arcobacter defluvii]RXI34750.1 sodium:proton exchanger [Arcobacter defluvii]BAK72411.1 sodium-hydrogen exchanger [Arcobacter sp. L]